MRRFVRMQINVKLNDLHFISFPDSLWKAGFFLMDPSRFMCGTARLLSESLIAKAISLSFPPRCLNRMSECASFSLSLSLTPSLSEHHISHILHTHTRTLAQGQIDPFFFGGGNACVETPKMGWVMGWVKVQGDSGAALPGPGLLVSHT